MFQKCLIFKRFLYRSPYFFRLKIQVPKTLHTRFYTFPIFGLALSDFGSKGVRGFQVRWKNIYIYIQTRI